LRIANLVQHWYGLAPLPESIVRLVTFHHAGRRQVGSVLADQVTPLTMADAQDGLLPLVRHLAEGGALPAAAGVPLPLSEVRLEAPLPHPRRNLFCVGRNYHAHAKELRETSSRTARRTPRPGRSCSARCPRCVVAPGSDVMPARASVSTQIDYEAELAIVIGRGGRNIPREQAMLHVFGYTIVNDVTARDVQMRHQQWDLGKSFDTFCPMGPARHRRRVRRRDTRVRCWVNGELRQDARTTDLIFDIPTLIETCSRGITLHPGDLIATGTCAGVGMGFDPPRWLRTATWCASRSTASGT
jgi:2-keto-4-pentenoate hydratase/2-oxohepta-3-ene-1,7-dioic acid hydratase in catechol pathway